MQRDVGAAATGAGWVLGAADPLASLQSLARAWREELGCPVVGITGSTGKTSVKDICRAILPGEVHASPENYNTEIGMPLAMLGAPRGHRRARPRDGRCAARARSPSSARSPSPTWR